MLCFQHNTCINMSTEMVHLPPKAFKLILFFFLSKWLKYYFYILLKNKEDPSERDEAIWPGVH